MTLFETNVDIVFMIVATIISKAPKKVNMLYIIASAEQ